MRKIKTLLSRETLVKLIRSEFSRHFAIGLVLGALVVSFIGHDNNGSAHFTAPSVPAAQAATFR